MLEFRHWHIIFIDSLISFIGSSTKINVYFRFTSPWILIVKDYVLPILGQLQRYYCSISICMVFSFSGVIPKAFHICSLASSQTLRFFGFYLILNVKAAIPLMICIHVPTIPSSLLQIRQFRRLEDGSLNVLARGKQRFRLRRRWIDVEGVVRANCCS